MDSGGMCVNPILDHLMQIPYADSLVTTAPAIITPHAKGK